MNRGALAAGLMVMLSLGAASCASPEQPVVASPRSEPPPAPAAPAAPAPPAPAQGGPIDPANVSISLRDAGVVINGTRLEGPTVADVKRLFGEPDRVDEKVNRIHVYDRYGFTAYEPYDGLVAEIQIYFAPESYAFVPKTMFRGHLDFRGQAIDKTTQAASLPGLEHDADLGWWKFKGQAFSFILATTKGPAGREVNHLSVAFPKLAASRPATHPREAACKAGSADACLTVMLAYMDGTSEDDARKTNTFAKLACDAGQSEACMVLAVNLENGRGGPASPAEAKRVYARACALGWAAACPGAK